MGYSLRDGIFFCITSETVVLLNLATNAYQMLGTGSGAAFRRLLAGELTEFDIETMNRLVAKGILIRGGDDCAVPTPASICAAKSSLLQDHRTVKAGQLLLQATSAQIIAAIKLRTSSLPNIVGSIKRRKRMGIARRVPISSDTQNRVTAAILQSQYLVPSAQKCLRRSMALIDLLAQHDQFPDLVIGVRVRPFNAHAWVQQDEMVLNDSLDEVLRYTPIMVV